MSNLDPAPISYFERGGMICGHAWWWSGECGWPFSTLRMTRESLEVSIGLWPFIARYRFARSEIKYLSMSWLRYGGIRIEHDRQDCPRLLIFESFRPKRLRDRLEALGYQVGQRESTWATVATLPSSGMWHSARAILSKEHITSRIGPSTGDSKDIRLEVPPAEAERAREILRQRFPDLAGMVTAAEELPQKAQEIP
jgi:hypothetical protein